MVKNLKFSRKALEWAVIFGFLCSVFLMLADFNVSCEQLRQNILRLHIVANSDSKADQELKLKIRDALLEESGNLFETDNKLDDAIVTAKENLPLFNEIANRVAKENGFSYTCTAQIGKAYFENREYDDFTLPAGNYESLIIKIGKAEGKNWWCVIFPQVCVPAAADGELSKSVGEEGVNVAENPKQFVIGFKTVEIYEDIKHFLFG